MRNIKINRYVLGFLFENNRTELYEYMKQETLFKTTSPNDTCVMQLCIFLAKFPNVFSIMSEDTVLQINSLIMDMMKNYLIYLKILMMILMNSHFSYFSYYSGTRYRVGRTGDHFMSLVKTDEIKNCCLSNKFQSQSMGLII